MFFRSRIILFAALFGGLLSLSSCRNAWQDFGDRSSDAFLIEEAKRQMDALNWDAAIANITPVLSSQPDNPEVVYLASAIYAGRAGLRILDIILAAGEGENKSLFELFTEQYRGAEDQDVEDIETAISILEDYGPTAKDRNSDLNFFSLFLYYSRIGVILNRYAYDSENSLRSNFTACHDQVDFDASTTGLPDPMIDRIMTAIPRIIDAAGGVTGGGIDGFGDVDFGIGDVGFDPIPCAEAVGVEEIAACQVVRTLVNSEDLGFGIEGEDPGDPSAPTCLP